MQFSIDFLLVVIVIIIYKWFNNNYNYYCLLTLTEVTTTTRIGIVFKKNPNLKRVNAINHQFICLFVISITTKYIIVACTRTEKNDYNFYLNNKQTNKQKQLFSR